MKLKYQQRTGTNNNKQKKGFEQQNIKLEVSYATDRYNLTYKKQLALM